MTPNKLRKTLAEHRGWLRDEPGGRHADLRGAYLRRAYLRGADLRFADLQDADR